jgi:large subunit ribosomal protein L12
MEYIYAAMLLHKAGKKIDEESMKKVIEAAGITPDNSKIKAIVSSLEGINIEEVISKAQTMQAAVSAEKKEDKKDEKKEEKKEEKVDEEKAAAGLGALFG